MNPRQMRGEEFQKRFGLFAPQPPVEGGAGDRLVDGDDDFELFAALMLPEVRLLFDPPCHALESATQTIHVDILRGETAGEPHAARAHNGRSGDCEIIVIGAPNLGDAPREDVEGQRDWWAD